MTHPTAADVDQTSTTATIDTTAAGRELSYALTTTLDLPVGAAVDQVKTALAEQGFGVLTEIDLQATLRARLGVEMPQHVILGACNPPLAHAALQAEPSIGLLLPCNVVVRSAADGATIVEAVDPQTMVALTGNAALQVVADEAARRLTAALSDLTGRSAKEQ